VKRSVSRYGPRDSTSAWGHAPSYQQTATVGLRPKPRPLNKDISSISEYSRVARSPYGGDLRAFVRIGRMTLSVHPINAISSLAVQNGLSNLTAISRQLIGRDRGLAGPIRGRTPHQGIVP
jgi:hypothetical protein